LLHGGLEGIGFEPKNKVTIFFLVGFDFFLMTFGDFSG
jgi:hypothetical protein